MQRGNVTTPFGRRPMTLALVRRQAVAADIKPGKSADKWKVFRDVSAAMVPLGVQSNSLAVLDALLSFYPDTVLRDDSQLIVFPSNVQLALRAHGMAGATLRRHLAILVDAGLILRKDSANGKRYARKDRTGQIETAFGFDLSPLLARADELAIMAQQVMAERSALRKAKENLTICRRDVRKLIAAAIEEGVEGNWQAIEDMYLRLVDGIARNATTLDTERILEAMQMLREEIIKRLESHKNSRDSGSNAARNEQHIQNSQTNSHIEFEPSSGEEQGGKVNRALPTGIRRMDRKCQLPIALVLKACPTIGDYAPGGLTGWRDLMLAAVVARSALGISPSAYQRACEVMGPETAAVVVACILERANFISTPGAYLRDLTQRMERGEFTPGPMVMALLNAQTPVHLKAG